MNNILENPQPSSTANKNYTDFISFVGTDDRTGVLEKRKQNFRRVLNSNLDATFSRGTSCNLIRKVQQPGSDIWPRPPTWILSRSCKSFFSVSFSLQTVYTQFNSLKINKRIKTSNVDFELCVFERPLNMFSFQRGKILLSRAQGIYRRLR